MTANQFTETTQVPSKTSVPAWLWALAAVAAGVVLAMFAPTFQRLLHLWNIDPDYSHGYLVGPASIFFAAIAWQRFQEQGSTALSATSGSVIYGVLEILFGVALHLLGLLFGVLLVDVLALICVLRGSLLLIAGPAWNKAFAFPILFLIFMAPLPPQAHQALAIFMQQTVASVSSLILNACGVDTYREGYFMHIPGYVMTVGEACSGLRSMMAILALAVAIGFMVNGSRFFSWTLTALALPVAGLANCLRVVLTGLIMLYIGREYAEDMYHTLEGVVMSAVAAGLLVAVAFGLWKLETAYIKPPEQQPPEKTDEAKPALEGAHA